MALSVGARLGPYEILSAIGAGGMGEVYKARDTRLDRTVAIKVLPAHVVDDPVVRMRFERESKTIAALNHPNICTLHDIGEAQNPEAGAASKGSIQFLVLEFIEGESLADRLAKGPLPLDQALRYGSQIADALDRAHRQGIIHRDLKPGNVMLATSGGARPGSPQAKLLDFGLAKQATPVASALGGLSTQTAGVITAQGTILGTCQYMAPEQLEGHDADSRSDIWAFGAVLYEMITGRPAFAGKSYVSLIGAILHRDPEPMSTLQPLSPPLLEHIVQGCLAKDPDDRWQSMADVRRELAWNTQSGAHVQPIAGLPVRAGIGRREAVAWSAAALAIVAALAAAWFGLSRAKVESTPPELRLTVSLPESAGAQRFAIVSPNGRQLAFVANASGNSGALWVRALDSMDDARMLAGTDGATLPFWSADSRSIGFFGGAKLRWIDLVTGVVQTICDAPSGRGGKWNRDNTIVFAPDLQVPLFRVAAAADAKPVALTALSTSAHELGHRLPNFLPDGRHFVLTVLGENGKNSLKIGSLDSSVTSELVPTITTQGFVSQGFLLFGRDQTLFAQPFDEIGLKLSGDATPIAPAVRPELYGWSGYSVSDAGLLVFRPATPAQPTQLAWFTRSGARVKPVGDAGGLLAWSLAPDGTRLAFIREMSRRRGERSTLWVRDLARDVATPLRSPPDTVNVAWSADSTRLVTSSLLGFGIGQLYVLPANGKGAPELVAGSPLDSRPQSWSPDGATLLFTALELSEAGPHYHLFIVPMPAARTPAMFAKDAAAGRFSPDGEWIAYVSLESGHGEIWVQPVHGGQRVPVTNSGGDLPYWTGDGREIVYASQGKVMAVTVRRSLGPGVGIGAPRALFDLPAGSVTWQPAGDGQQFLIEVPVGAKPPAPPLTVIVNWTAGVRR